MVRVDDALANDAADILTDHGAVDVDKRREHLERQGFTSHDASAPAYTPEQIERERESYRAAFATQSDRTLGQTSTERAVGGRQVVEQAEATVPVIEENLAVGKRRVERGGIRVYTTVTETPVTESVTLREQHASVSRVAVDRPVSPDDTAAFKEQTFEVREFAEAAVVAKEARVVEEVTIRKQVEDHTEVIQDTVRRTDVEVLEVEDVAVESAKTATYKVPPPPKTAQ